MKRRSKGKRLFGRILRSLGCLGFLGVLGVGGFLGYQALKPLLTSQTPGMRPEMATEDVAVTRGDLTDMIQIYGVIQTNKEASLGFTKATGKVVSVNVMPGQPVQAGQVLIELDREALQRDVAQAKADLLEAQTTLAEFDNPPSATDRLRLQADLLRANDTLDKAKRALEAFDAGQDTPQSKRDEAAQALKDARLALQTLQNSKDRKEQIDTLQWVYNIAEVQHGPYVLIQNPSEKDQDMEWLLRIDMLNKQDDLNSAKLQYQIDMGAAKQAVVTAQQKLDEQDRQLAAGAQDVERLKLDTAVQVATSDVSRLQAELASLGEQRPNVDRAKAEADVLKKGWVVEDAEAALADAQLVAPFDGIAENVNIAVGDTVSGSSALVSIMDPSDIYAEARVTDIDVGYLKGGQQVQVRFDAFQGAPPITGTLGAIPLYGTYQDGVTYFAVPVSFDAGEMMPMVGMTVNLAIPKAEKKDVLMIPAMAVYYEMTQPFVYKVVDGQMSRQDVQVGISDGIQVEILEGLSEGDTVRVPMQSPVGPYGMGYGG